MTTLYTTSEMQKLTVKVLISTIELMCEQYQIDITDHIDEAASLKRMKKSELMEMLEIIQDEVSDVITADQPALAGDEDDDDGPSEDYNDTDGGVEDEVVVAPAAQDEDYDLWNDGEEPDSDDDFADDVPAEVETSLLQPESRAEFIARIAKLSRGKIAKLLITETGEDRGDYNEFTRESLATRLADLQGWSDDPKPQIIAPTEAQEDDVPVSSDKAPKAEKTKKVKAVETRTVDDLLAALSASPFQSERKKIRAALRAAGYRISDHKVKAPKAEKVKKEKVTVAAPTSPIVEKTKKAAAKVASKGKNGNVPETDAESFSASKTRVRNAGRGGRARDKRTIAQINADIAKKG